jgi:hypothetical protein
LSELLELTRQQHRADNFETDDQLLRFVSQKPITTYAMYGERVKGIFKANRTPLQASFNSTFTHSTRKISAGILKAIYDSLPRDELRIIQDFQTYRLLYNPNPIELWG